MHPLVVNCTKTGPAPAQSMRNIEIKARTKRQNEIRRILEELGAVIRGIDHQTDTYFQVPRGRLKLREGTIENSLIYYDRPHIAGPGRSDVAMAHPGDAKALKEVLARSWGILCIVKKRREILFIDNAKFHIDEVDGLGGFVEIEIIDKNDAIDLRSLHAQCYHYMEVLGVTEPELVACSYADLIMEHQ